MPTEVVVSPSTQVVVGGTAIHPTPIASGALNTGDVLTFGFASAVHDAGVTRTTFDVILQNGVGGPQLINRDTAWTQTNLVVTYTATAPTPFALILVGGGQPPDSSHGQVFGYHAEINRVSLVPCAYGTELQPTASFVYYLTPGLLDVWLAEVGMPWLAPLFTATWFTTFNAENLCSSGPPPFPTIDLSTLEASAQTIAQILQCIAWPNVCRCKAGTPAPIPFPQPSAPQPTGWPTPPVITCSEADLCSSLVSMQRQLAALQQALSSNLELTTLLQRYSLPFSYIRGATHSIASGGTFAISRLVGVQVVVTAHADNLRTFTGAPTYIADLGWLSILGNDGISDEIRLTRDVQTWFPRMMPLATQFGLGLRDGVTVQVTELEAEP